MITWNTPAGGLGTIKELEYSEIPLSATDSDEYPLEYIKLSGTMPSGMQVTSTGVIKGIPTITSNTTARSVPYPFTVRAANALGIIADRTFTIVITNQSTLTIDPGELFLSTFDDGKLLSYQFHATSENPNATLSWSVISGELPNDIRTGKPITLSSDGLLSGYVDRLIDTTGATAGYDVENDDSYPYDFSNVSRSKLYSFQIQASDGFSVAKSYVRINIVSKSHYTADNDITIINDTALSVDADNHYVPIITTDPSVIPTLQSGNKFAFKFNAIDPEDDVVYWTSSGIPNGLSLSSVTGWLTGTIPAQTEETKTYTFTITAYKRDKITYISLPLTVEMTTVRDIKNYVTWSSPTVMGPLVNGSISELAISAVSTLDKDVVYSYVSGRMPEGLKLLTNGDIIGRSTFEYFGIDGRSSTILVSSADGIEVGMTVEGVGVAAGTLVSSINGPHSVTVAPAIYAQEGTELTFRDLLLSTEIITQLTSLSTTTTIDGGTTTFDSTYKFIAKAETTDMTASSTKEFTIIVDNYNRAPYENIYLKAMPSISQRALFNNVIADTDIFPDTLIYRSNDPWFGKSTDIKMLFLPGLTSSSLSAFANAIQYNHYNKQINFGNIKTARAVDSNFNTKYEVVYLEVIDDRAGAPLSTEPVVSQYYDNIYHTIYPNSFDNMSYCLGKNIGYSNRGALPGWMTSPQEDGKVLGLTRAVVLAHTVPGASKLIAYRLKNTGINFNNINFVADRYELDTTLSRHYDVENNQFNNSGYVRTHVVHDAAWAAITGTVDEYIPGPQTQETTFDTNTTEFDHRNTRFFANSDIYAEPESGDKYIKFSQIGVYR